MTGDGGGGEDGRRGGGEEGMMGGWQEGRRGGGDTGSPFSLVIRLAGFRAPNPGPGAAVMDGYS